MIAEGVYLVKTFEGISLKPYLCPGRVWTIGYGTTKYPNGKRVTKNDPCCTEQQAYEYLSIELDSCEQTVIAQCKPYLNDYQRAALASFVYNLGSGSFFSSTLRRRINSMDWDDVPYQLSRWNKAGGRILKGLVLRRKAEANLWSYGVNKHIWS